MVLSGVGIENLGGGAFLNQRDRLGDRRVGNARTWRAFRVSATGFIARPLAFPH